MKRKVSLYVSAQFSCPTLIAFQRFWWLLKRVSTRCSQHKYERYSQGHFRRIANGSQKNGTTTMKEIFPNPASYPKHYSRNSFAVKCRQQTSNDGGCICFAIIRDKTHCSHFGDLQDSCALSRSTGVAKVCTKSSHVFLFLKNSFGV